jgi:hypothetical protein
MDFHPYGWAAGPWETQNLDADRGPVFGRRVLHHDRDVAILRLCAARRPRRRAAAGHEQQRQGHCDEQQNPTRNLRLPCFPDITPVNLVSRGVRQTAVIFPRGEETPDTPAKLRREADCGLGLLPDGTCTSEHGTLISTPEVPVQLGFGRKSQAARRSWTGYRSDS